MLTLAGFITPYLLALAAFPFLAGRGPFLRIFPIHPNNGVILLALWQLKLALNRFGKDSILGVGDWIFANPIVGQCHRMDRLFCILLIAAHHKWPR